MKNRQSRSKNETQFKSMEKKRKTTLEMAEEENEKTNPPGTAAEAIS